MNASAVPARRTGAKRRWLTGCGLALGALAVLCAAGWAIFTLFFPPLYQVEQVASSHAGYRRTTLTHGNAIYVNDYEESALAAFGEPPTERVGWTWGGVPLYAIPGQGASAYVLEYDPMYQVVYRSIEHPPFDWRNAEFQHIRLSYQEPINPRESDDPLLIEEILSALKNGTRTVVPMQADGNYSDTRNYTLILFSDQLPGLMYLAAAHETKSGEIFLAENPISNEWATAGPLFTEFIKETP
jgi:hypothetical protein